MLRLRVPLGFLFAGWYLGVARPSSLVTFLACLVLVFLGCALRSWAAGYLLKGKRVAVGGPYSYIRNPLYVGSFILGAGFCAALWRWPLPVSAWIMGLSFFLGFGVVYRAKTLAEEKELAANLGDPYVSYAQRVPAFLPFKGHVSGLGPQHFSWELYRRNREYQCVIGSLAVLGLLLYALEAHAVEMPPGPVVSVSTFMVSASTPQISTFTWRSLPNTAFGTGEDLQFVVKWGLVTAGYSNLSVTEIKEVNGRTTYHLVSKARSGGVVNTFYKVNDNNEAWLDQGSLITVRYEKQLHEGKYQIEETSLLDQPTHRWKTRSYRLDKNTYEEKEGDLTENATDALGSLYYIRTLPLDVGQVYTLDVHSGDKVYPLTLKVLKRQKVSVPAGKFDCLLVEPFLRGPGIFISKGKKLEVWLTDDSRHMPVRMRSEVFIGHVSAELLPTKTSMEGTNP